MTENASPLKIAAISLDIVFANPEKNVENALGLIEGLEPDVDIVVLPELFTTSFISDKTLLAKCAEADDGPSLTALRGAAARKNCMIAGSYAAHIGDDFFNRGFMILPSGKTEYYNKRHLFSVSAEAEVFTAGTAAMPVVNFKGWNVSMMVCYDLRFPVWSRNVNHRYDMLLVPANWPVSRGYAWTHLLIARAIENQAVVVGANRGGRDEYGEYDGLTEIFDGVGRPTGHDSLAGQAVIASVSPEELTAARRRLPAHFDADDFCISI